MALQVGSVHQTFTEDEDCMLIAVWPGRYVLFDEVLTLRADVGPVWLYRGSQGTWCAWQEQLPQGVFMPVNHKDQATEHRQTFSPQTMQLADAGPRR